jgi:hypothetical protein
MCVASVLPFEKVEFFYSPPLLTLRFEL